MREKTAQEVYDDLSREGKYKAKDIDYDIIRKIRNITTESSEYIEFLLKQKVINYMVIYTLYYEVLRELCEALVRTEGIKVSNHQGCFAYICIKFPELELDWNFFEKIRTTRNRNKYEGSEIAKQDWREIEVQIKLYASTVRKAIDQKLDASISIPS